MKIEATAGHFSLCVWVCVCVCLFPLFVAPILRIDTLQLFSRKTLRLKDDSVPLGRNGETGTARRS